MNNEESYLTVKVENTLKLLLAAGIMLSFVGLTYPIVMKKLFEHDSQGIGESGNARKGKTQADISKYDDIDHEEMMLMTSNMAKPHSEEEDDGFWE